jgi:hypothetical protein
MASAPSAVGAKKMVGARRHFDLDISTVLTIDTSISIYD